MERLFIRILQMSAAGGIVILAVLFLRLLMRRAPGRFRYLLWVVPAFRLCVPLSLPSPVSLFRLLRGGPLGNRDYTPAGLTLPLEKAVPAAGSGISGLPAASAETAEAASALSWLQVLAWVWLAVIAALLLYSLVSSLLLHRKLATAVRLEGRVFQVSGIDTPFLLGLFRPRIYIPWGTEGADLEYALTHEYCHIRRGDPWWRLLGWLILCVHWYNPLCWLGYFFMGRDMEQSCDEAVLEHLGDVRREYSESLLRIAGKSRLSSPAPLAFGESGVGGRVRNVLRWKKAGKRAIACSLLICLLFIAACATDPIAAAIDKTVTLNPDGTFGNLEWGMSPEEVLAADSRIEMTESFNDFYAFAELKGARVLGYTADISLCFSKRRLEDGIHKGPEGRPILDGIDIYIPGEVSVTEALTSVFGEMEKRKPSDNEWDIVDGVPVIHWLPNELPEEKWYWHTDPVYMDIPIEQLRLSIPWYSDETLLGAWCSTFGCKVYVNPFESEDGMTTDISFIGYGFALKRFLAEEYQRMTEAE